MIPVITPTVSIIMPAYNAQEHIQGVFERIPAQWWPHVINAWVIDDGSVDKTSTVIGLLSSVNAKIKPLRFERNSGYGAALKKGLSLCRTDGCMIAICLHADGQYPPEIIPGALSTMLSRGLDIMQGSRIASGTALSGGMPLYKFIANRTLTFLENRVFGLSLTDYHSGMLFYSRRALETLPFERFSDSFDFDVEVIAAARANNLAIGEIPIPTHYGTELSHVRSIPYGIRVLDAIAKYKLGRYRER